jgi:hypothetical protein
MLHLWRFVTTFRSCLSLLAVLAISGACSLAFAGDPSSKLLPRSPSYSLHYGVLSDSSTWGFSGHQQTPAVQPKKASTSKSWPQRGKVMTIIGLGVVGAGAILMPQRDRPGSNEFVIDNTATGAIFITADGVLAAVGLTRRD